MLKALLMSSSYRVRVATSRLITTVCNNGGGNSGDQHLSYNPAASTGADRGVAERSQLFGAFFREKLIAAGVTGAYCTPGTKHALIYAGLWGSNSKYTKISGDSST